MWAFDGCRQLTELDLPADLDTVGQGAFYDFPHCDALPCNGKTT